MIEIVAILFFGALGFYSVLQVIAIIKNGITARRNIALERNSLRTRLQKSFENHPTEKLFSKLSWSGYRKFEITRKVREGCDIFSFYLSPHDQKALPAFLPGQYLTFRLDPKNADLQPKIKSGNSKPVIRCYSLSEGPQCTDYYRITIKKVLPPPDRPDLSPGLVSGYFHDYVNEGDILDASAPRGNFHIDLSSEAPVVLIGGGIGVTPVLSMLNAIAAGDSKRETWFFYGVCDGNQHLMKDHLKQVAESHSNIQLHICYSDATEKDVLGKDYHHEGHVSVDMLKQLLPSNRYEFYICGPPPMMDQIVHELKEWGVSESKIFFEAFGPATVKKITQVKSVSAEKKETVIEVTFAQSGKKCTWKRGGGTLLELAEENGVSIDSGCRAGNCGTCLTTIKSGDVEYLMDHGAKIEAGSCLTCISIPKSTLILEV